MLPGRDLVACDIARPRRQDRRPAGARRGLAPRRPSCPSPASWSCRARSTCICISATATTFRARAAGGRRAGDRGGGVGRHHLLHPLSDGGRSVRARSVRRRVARHRSRARGSISAIISASRPRRSSRASGATSATGACPRFKIFMNNRGGEGKRLGLPDIDDGFLFRLCEAAAAAWRHGLPASGNDRARLGDCASGSRAADPEGKGGLASLERHPAALRRSRRRAARGADRRCRRRAALRRAYLLGGRRCEAGLRQRRAGMRVHLETCPHYLTHDVTWAGGDIGKINPPLREPADREALWQRGAGRRRRHGRDRPCASRRLGQAGRHLGRLAGLPGAGDAAARAAERGASQARA